MGQRQEALKQELQSAREELLRAVEGLTEEQWARPTDAEGWSVRDVFAHLAYNQPSQARLIRNILDGNGGTPANFDLAYYNRRGVEKQRQASLEQLHAALAAGHADTLALLDTLTDAQLDTLGNHASAGTASVETILRTIARHDREHTGHIRGGAARP